MASVPAFVIVALSVAVASGCARPHGADPATSAREVSVVRVEQSSGTRALLIAVSPVSDLVVWASGSQGTWVRTIDGGATWTTGRVPGADSLQFRDVHAVDANTAYLLSIGDGPQSRIYKTRDAGATWTRVSPQSLPAAEVGEGSFAASGSCVETGANGRAWIVMNTPARSRLLRTADYGRSWSLETLPVTTHEGSGAQSVVFRDARHGMVLAGGSGVRPGDVLVAVTADGGETWTPRAGPAFKVGSWGGAVVPGAGVPTFVAVGTNGGATARPRRAAGRRARSGRDRASAPRAAKRRRARQCRE